MNQILQFIEQTEFRSSYKQNSFSLYPFAHYEEVDNDEVFLVNLNDYAIRFKKDYFPVIATMFLEISQGKPIMNIRKEELLAKWREYKLDIA
jgi:hypothetical protein